LEFNSHLWDDEIIWEEDYKDKSLIDYITYRDAPGYFVILPRLIHAFAHLVPGNNFPLSLRSILIALNIFTIFFAAKLLVDPDKDAPSFLLMFCCFSSIYVEDLNYLHNLGYFFIFPILYIMQK